MSMDAFLFGDDSWPAAPLCYSGDPEMCVSMLEQEQCFGLGDTSMLVAMATLERWVAAHGERKRGWKWPDMAASSKCFIPFRTTVACWRVGSWQ